MLSFKVLQLMSSVYTMITGTVCSQQGSGSSWVEYLQRKTPTCFSDLEMVT